MKSYLNKNNQKGVVIIITFLTLGILLTLGTYFLAMALAESKISKSQEIATRTYYLAEAGVNEAIWKLKNDDTADEDDPWKTCFTTTSDGICDDCETWSDTFTRNYSQNSTATVSIENSDCAQGEIIATSTIYISPGKTAQRVIKVKVLKSLGSLTEDSPVFAGAPSGEATILLSNLNVYYGNIFSNNNISIKNWSTVNLYDDQSTNEQEGLILAYSNIIKDPSSTLYASGTCDDSDCSGWCEDYCPIEKNQMPAVDFDSSESTSYKSKAEQAEQYGQCEVEGKKFGGDIVVDSTDCVFTEDKFEYFLETIEGKGTLFLKHKASQNGTSTYYVEGGINLKGERYLNIDGVLIADGTINIGEKKNWGGASGNSHITITDPGVGIPSGILTKRKINFGPYSASQNASIVGLIYSQDETRITSLPYSFDINGGMIARKFSLSSVFDTVSLNIYLDNAIIREGVWGGSSPPGGSLPFSPVITIEHWEEAY